MGRRLRISPKLLQTRPSSCSSICLTCRTVTSMEPFGVSFRCHCAGAYLILLAVTPACLLVGTGQTEVYVNLAISTDIRQW